MSINSTEIYVTELSQNPGQMGSGDHSAAAADPSSAGWLAALSTAYHVMKDAGHVHEAGKLLEMLEHHGRPSVPIAGQSAASHTILALQDIMALNYDHGQTEDLLAVTKADLRAILERRFAIVPENRPTDLSHRLRETGDQQPGWKSLLTAAADEIERYYVGMLAWKGAAEAKDADVAQQRSALAAAVHDAAVKRGIIAPNTELSRPQLLLLCDDLATLPPPVSVVVVVEVDNGVINCARSDGPAHVIILDADTEGASDENVFEAVGQNWNVTQFSLQYAALDGQAGIATEYVRGVVADLEAAPAPAMYLTGTWEHIFVGTRQSDVRLVFDLASNKIIAMQHVSGRGTFSLASAEEMADVQDSIVNANPEALINPDDFGLTAVATLPEWACGTFANPSIDQFVREMAAAGVGFGLLVGELIDELQQHPDQDKVQELEWEIISEVRDHVIAAVESNAGPTSDDQYLAVHYADSWVTQQVKGLPTVLYASIGLTSADETTSRVHAITRPGENDQAPAP